MQSAIRRHHPDGHNFVEWHVIIVKNPAILIQGERQFTAEKAQPTPACSFERYIPDEKHGDASDLPSDFTWTPLESGEWLGWRP